MIDVKTLCLGVLSRGDASGYEIRKAFDEGALSHFSDAGFGSIYPALKRLTEDGHIQLLPQEGEGRPDKKVYRITPAGRSALYQALARQPSPDKLRSDFMFIVSFGHLLQPRHLDRVVGDRIAYLRRLVEQMDRTPDSHASAGERFVDGLSRALYVAAADYLEKNRNSLLDAGLQTSRVAE